MIPYKTQNDSHRELLWSIVRQRYEMLMPELEICLGLDDSPLYNRARAINNAAQKASGDIFLITDADVVFPKSLIPKIIYVSGLYPWAVPFTRGLKLNRSATERLIKDGIPEEPVVQDTDAEFIMPFAGPLMNIVTRESFENIRGMDERFEGWGGEDDAMRISLNAVCGQYCRIKGDIWHLWHQPAPILKEFYDQNCRLLDRYREAEGCRSEILKLISEKHY